MLKIVATAVLAASSVSAKRELDCSEGDGKHGQDCCAYDCKPEVFDCTGKFNPRGTPPPKGACDRYEFDMTDLCKANYPDANDCTQEWDATIKQAGDTGFPVDRAGKDKMWQAGKQTCNGDWLLADEEAHTYAVSICSPSYWKCMPSTWRNTYYYGNVVQYWGATPAADDQACAQQYACPSTDPDCDRKTLLADPDAPTGDTGCTADCQVLAVGEPDWELLAYDAGSTEVGTLRATFTGAVPSEEDPFWCPFDTKTGMQEARKVEFVFVCDASVNKYPNAETTIDASSGTPGAGKKQMDIEQNVTNDCHYRVTIYTPAACSNWEAAESGSFAQAFVLIVLIGAAVCVLGSCLHTKHTQGEWGTGQLGTLTTDLVDTAKDGVAFVVSGGNTTGGSKGYSQSGGGSNPPSGVYQEAESSGEPQYDTL